MTGADQKEDRVLSPLTSTWTQPAVLCCVIQPKPWSLTESRGWLLCSSYFNNQWLLTVVPHVDLCFPTQDEEHMYSPVVLAGYVLLNQSHMLRGCCFRRLYFDFLILIHSVLVVVGGERSLHQRFRSAHYSCTQRERLNLIGRCGLFLLWRFSRSHSVFHLSWNHRGRVNEQNQTQPAENTCEHH